MTSPIDPKNRFPPQSSSRDDRSGHTKEELSKEMSEQSQKNFEENQKDRHVIIRNKYDVIIRPSSPPFVTVVLKNPQQSISPPKKDTLPDLDTSSINSNDTSSLKTESFVSATTSLIADGPSSSVTDNHGRRLIFSSVSRRLAEDKRIEDTTDVVERSLELLPSTQNYGPDKQQGSLSIKSPKSVANILNGLKNLASLLGNPTLGEVDSQSLDALWDGGRGHIAFNELIQRLFENKEVLINWQDEDGQSRANPPLPKRMLLRKVNGLDPGSSLSSLKRGPFKTAQSRERGYLKTDASTALVLSSLYRRDFHNFARIIAAQPQIISTLLDKKNIRPGKIFSDDTIWLCIAYSIPRLKSLGGLTSGPLKLLSRAFENYLTYHNPSNGKGPYIRAMKWAYAGGLHNADALANSPIDFSRNFERIWSRLSPERNALRDVIDRGAVLDDLDSMIASFLLNIVFSGIELHLHDVAKRREKYLKAVQGMFSLGTSVPLEAMKNATTPVDGGLSGGAAARISDQLIQQGGKKLAEQGVNEDFESLRQYYQTLRESLINNASEGRFVPGQRILTSNQMLALLPSASFGRTNEDDKRSGEGDPSSIRVFFRESEVGVDKIRSEQEFEEIGRRRREFGETFSRRFISVNQHNPITNLDK